MKKMFERGCAFLLVLITCVAGLVGVAGCSSTSTDSSGSTIQSILDSALSAAATVLQNEGVQDAAIAAAEAYVAQSIDDPDQAAVYNSVIEAAIPALAEAVGSFNTTAAASTTDTTGEKAVKLQFKDTAQFKDILHKAVLDYSAKASK